MDAVKYIEILELNLIPFIEESNKNYIFQHDNDSKHTANKTCQFLKDNNIKTLKWPAYSPDLNPIENIWGILKRNVRKRIPKDKNNFIKIINEEWDALNKNITKSLIDSMPNRIREVIKNKGDSTTY